MILIISSFDDLSTHQVCEWLIYEGIKKFTVINQLNAITSIEIHLKPNNKKSIGFYLQSGHFINVDKLKAVWYRRGDFFYGSLMQSKTESQTIFFENLNNEWTTIKEFLLHEIEGISNFRFTTVNKLLVLNHAAEVGLKTPETLICSSKLKLVDHFLNKRIVNKPISQCINKQEKDKVYNTKTIEVERDIIPDHFFPSKFQELIDKKYELRVFYLLGTFYSMAIFSQLDKKTQIDFRNYNYEKPNRVVPYILPDFMEIKLRKLMQILNLDSASIDLIVTKNDDYVFLEVNPVGQFGMVSEPCNYNLEKIITQHLIDRHEEATRKKEK